MGTTTTTTTTTTTKTQQTQQHAWSHHPHPVALAREVPTLQEKLGQADARARRQLEKSPAVHVRRPLGRRRGQGDLPVAPEERHESAQEVRHSLKRSASRNQSRVSRTHK